MQVDNASDPGGFPAYELAWRDGQYSPEPRTPPGIADVRGRHRIRVELNRLHQEIRSLEEELQSLERAPSTSKACKELIEFMEASPDPLMPNPSAPVVALVSGGKDSCYAMMRCIHFGHEIVALANLLPQNDTVDELDSYMYQTVGHQIVEAFAQCMGLPLFRKRIGGKPKTFDLRYTHTDGDEVEDLEVLLRHVKERIPSVSAVSSGAIASDYQRLRVENVCSRLGLVSLAYLWKQDQAELLQQMVESGISAVLVKVAAMGLYPYKHLGKELSFLHPLFVHLHEQYGCNICGEGGEYESLTLDCPLFKNAKIVLDGFDIVLQSTGSIAPVGILHPTKFHLELKPDVRNSDSANGIVHWVGESVKDPVENKSSCKDIVDSKKTYGDANECIASFTKHQDTYVTISCWRKENSTESAGQELSLLLSLVHTQLQKEGLGWADVLYIHLYLQSMKDLAEVNGVYSQHITEIDCLRGVPSRSTIEVPLAACGLGSLMVEVLAARDQTKQVLHVQSISSWAPSCIGPYSQASLHGSLLFMAGQIGLDPSAMTLVTGGSGAEMHQVLRNCEAVAAEFGSSLTCSSICITVYCNFALSRLERRDAEDRLVSFLTRDSNRDDAARNQPLILFVLVSGLPKGANVEVEPLVLCSSEKDCKAKTRKTLMRVPAIEIIQESMDNSELLNHPQNWKGRSLACSCDNYTVPGRFCRALVSLCASDGLSFDTSESAEILQSNVGNSQLTVFLRSRMVELVRNILRDSELSWSDVLAFRVYFLANEICHEALRRCIEEQIPEPQLVPVHGIGNNCDLSSLVTFDVLARR